MREIEVKAKVHDLNELLKRASELGIKLSNPIIQQDQTYAPTVSHDDPNWNIFRIRKQGGRIILTMKYRASTRPRDNYELETDISNEADIIQILNRLGYSPGVCINKTRRIASYKDMEICIDKVEALGTYIEVEKMTEDNVDVDKVQDYLWHQLLELGIREGDRETKGYSTLIAGIVPND